MRVLLVVDLEGVAGVDDLADLVAGSPGHERARDLMTEEVVVASRALRAAGYERVRISDSHVSGSGEPNVRATALDEYVELCLEEDPYAAHLFEGVDAVACLGMHAAAGLDGFAAHTVNLHSRWRMGGRLLSETDLVLGLASERGLPFLFATGDEVLGASLPSVIPFLVTKRRYDGGWRSSPRGEVLSALDRLARAARGVLIPPLPPQPIELQFKSRWQAEQVAAEGLTRAGPTGFEISAPSFRATYRRAWALTEEAGEGLAEAFRGELGSPEFVEDVRDMLARGFDPAPVRVEPLELERARDAFLRLTEGESSESRALRALILHMLEHHAPRAFLRLSLGPVLDRALDALALVPAALTPDLDPDELQARVDARYLERARARPGPALDPSQLVRVCDALALRGDDIYAFILGSIGAALGCAVPERFLEAPVVSERVIELYVSTHRLLFAAEYLTRPLAPGELVGERERLLLGVPFVRASAHVDLAAELGVLLQALGEHHSTEHAALVALVRAHTAPTGVVEDASLGVAPSELADHATGLALLLLAGAAERFEG